MAHNSIDHQIINMQEKLDKLIQYAHFDAFSKHNEIPSILNGHEFNIKMIDRLDFDFTTMSIIQFENTVQTDIRHILKSHKDHIIKLIPEWFQIYDVPAISMMLKDENLNENLLCKDFNIRIFGYYKLVDYILFKYLRSHFDNLIGIFPTRTNTPIFVFKNVYSVDSAIINLKNVYSLLNIKIIPEKNTISIVPIFNMNWVYLYILIYASIDVYSLSYIPVQCVCEIMIYIMKLNMGVTTTLDSNIMYFVTQESLYVGLMSILHQHINTHKQ